MRHNNDNGIHKAGGIHPRMLGADLWDTICRLCTDWMVAARAEDTDGAAAIEQELRFFVLFYVALPDDGAVVTTGRKAILRRLYEDLGDESSIRVSAMLTRVIDLEQHLARP